MSRNNTKYINDLESYLSEKRIPMNSFKKISSRSGFINKTGDIKDTILYQSFVYNSKEGKIVILPRIMLKLVDNSRHCMRGCWCFRRVPALHHWQRCLHHIQW